MWDFNFQRARKMESSRAQWSNLPSDLLELILKRLNSPIDLLRFRSVCAKWRSSAHLLNSSNSTPHFPIKLPMPTCIDPDLRVCSVLLRESTIYKISDTSKTTTKSWIVRVEESSAENGKVRLRDPLSPSLFGNSTKNFPKVWNLLNLRVSEVSRAYDLKLLDEKARTFLLKKVVTSGSIDNFAVMTLHRRGKLGIWKVGEKKWIQIEDGPDWCKYIDIAYHNGKFYAVDIKGLTISVDFSLQIKYIAPPGVRSGFHYYDDRGRYLVNALGNLLLIDSPPARACDVHFNVYRLNEEESQWVLVDKLGDQMLFLGDDCSFSVSARDFAGCKRNCIYFTILGYTMYSAYPGYNAWLFNLEDRSAKPLSAIPSIPNLFQPPSSWTKSRKKRLAVLLGRSLVCALNSQLDWVAV